MAFFMPIGLGNTQHLCIEDGFAYRPLCIPSIFIILRMTSGAVAVVDALSKYSGLLNIDMGFFI